MATTTATLPRYKGAELGRSTVQASRSAFAGLLLRDLSVLRKNLFREFLPRTILQPFLLVFVFLYVFPTIGQGIGGGAAPCRRRGRTACRSGRAFGNRQIELDRLGPRRA